MKTRVLVVEDNEMIALAIRTVLEAGGMVVVHCPTGAAALAEASRERPDVVTLDVRLPDVDGDEVCRRLRAEAGLAGVGVLLLSANSQEVFRERALSAGADRFMGKPFKAGELLGVVRELAALSASRRAA